MGTVPDAGSDTAEAATEPEVMTEEIVPEAVVLPGEPDAADELIKRVRDGIAKMRLAAGVQAGQFFLRTIGADVDIDKSTGQGKEYASAENRAAPGPRPKRAAVRPESVQPRMSPQAYLNLLNSMDHVKKEMVGDIAFNQTVLGSAIAVSTGLSVGYVVWLVRGGMLLSTLLSSMPAWQILDPLPILARKNKDDSSEDDESLESILDRKPEKPEPKPNAEDALPDAERGKR